MSTSTFHSGEMKSHDWAVAQLADLFCTTAKVKTSNITTSQGVQKRGDIQLDAYLADAAGPTPFIMDLRIIRETYGSSS